MVLVLLDQDERPLVRVLPITHQKPANPQSGLEVPALTKTRLGLDDERSWVFLDKANDFRWPGPDLRPAINGDLNSILYGVLPPGFMKQLAIKLRLRRQQALANRVRRTE